MKKILLGAVIGAASMVVVLVVGYWAMLPPGAEITSTEIDGVTVVQIIGSIDDRCTRRVLNALAQVERKGATSVVIWIDSPGGGLSASLDLSEGIWNSKLETTGVVAEGLGSAVLVVAAFDCFYVTPEAVVGAALPVSSFGDELAEGMMRKIVSMLGARIRTVASTPERAQLLTAMVDPDVELMREGSAWKRKGEVLTLTAAEAVALGLAEGICRSVDEAREKVRKGANQSLQPTPIPPGELGKSSSN